MVAEELVALAKNMLKNVATGEKVPMESLWADQPCVLFFLRRFACPFCRVDAVKYSEMIDKFEKNNVKMVGIGHEETGLQDFIDGKYWKSNLYIDEGKASYAALGYKRYSFLSIWPAILTKASKAKSNEAKTLGVGGDMTTGDGYQSGGVLIVGKGGEQVLLNFKQETPDQSVPNADILKALGIEV